MNTHAKPCKQLLFILQNIAFNYHYKVNINNYTGNANCLLNSYKVLLECNDINIRNNYRVKLEFGNNQSNLHFFELKTNTRKLLFTHRASMCNGETNDPARNGKQLVIKTRFIIKDW